MQTLLDQLEQNGVLMLHSNWSDLFSTFQDDPRYTNMLGQSGVRPGPVASCLTSTPGTSCLDLFKLRVDELKDRLISDRKRIRDYFDVWAAQALGVGE